MGNQYTEYDDPWHDEEWLHEQYVVREKSAPEIAEDCGAGSTTIYKWLDRFDIERRDHDDASSISHPGPPDEPYTDEGWLREQYVEKRRSGTDIADACGVSKQIVYKYLDRFGIERRDNKTAQNLVDSDPPGEKYTDEAWLREQYCERELTIVEIADLCGVSTRPISYWLNKHGIETRDAPPPKNSHLRGEDHPMWKGGRVLSYGDGWNESKRQRVRERDDQQCQDCGMAASEHRSRYGCTLHVHHIVPARRFDDEMRRNAMSNLLTLCSRCHRKWEAIPGLRPQ